MSPKDKDYPHTEQFILKASTIARTHTILAYTAFTSTLALGLLLHYEKIVKNAIARYSEEWFPSVSTTIGDWYPERNVFQIFIVLTSGPRIALVSLLYYLQRSQNSSLPTIVFVSVIIRTLSCGGWVYITSTNDHNVHGIFMIMYIVLNLPWIVGGIYSTSQKCPTVRRKRSIIASLFFLSIVPLVYFFIQHKVHRIPGAYTHYSFFEWGLIFYDVLYDAYAEEEFRLNDLRVAIEDLKSVNGNVAPAKVKYIHIGGSPSRQERSKSPKIRTYIFWSVFTSLIPTLFYFSVWEFTIARSELALFSTLSPIWLSIPLVLNWARTRGGQSAMHLLSFIRVAAYILKSPLRRLFLVAFATPAAMIPRVVTWHDDPAYQSIMTNLGLLLSSLSKHVNHSNNPVWLFVNEGSGGHNKEGLIVALLAFLYLLLWLLGALPLGSFIFILHSLLADPSTLIAWSWMGYEDGRPRGPLPHVHGSLTLLCQSIGLFIALQAMKGMKVHFLANPLWFAFGSASSYAMYTYMNWPGYLGGLGLAIFMMGSIPPILYNVSSTGAVFRTSFAAMLVYCLLAFANVWIVAYAFVPGGVYLRERTDLVVIAQMCWLAPAFNFFLYCTTLALISVLGVLATLYRLPATPTQPFRPEHRMLRAGIWTIHFGIDNEGRDSQRRVMNLIKDMELDVVGLLETDLYRTVYVNRDLTRVIIEDVENMRNVDLGPGPNSHTWGAVLLSKFPIINSTHHLLPSPHGELAPAIEAVLDVYGTAVTVVVSHNGQEEDPLDRELQSRKLAEIMSAAYPRPIVFLGYVVTCPHAPRQDYDRWCEYILYRSLYRTSYARVSRSTVTDTELQVAQFVLPKHGRGVTNETEIARYLRSRKEGLPSEHWFPMAYYGNQRWGGVNGDFYHPLYYAIPDNAEI
ncbi:Frag1/DRAM/Sfk1 family-domain-containing protein [Lentinula aciculospora]|uniref:Frag1/DRAM/Sfk1 family-domain-containing protein n=1 Tax=Lentinula aciculospora TaxID=153920 RepID=A0A9W9ADB8_9AGAR|nr:Frag1/DRAM/Sfk1 family-domain-containing protein [Lentinula aciculospora]